jgi:hypothetical protein
MCLKYRRRLMFKLEVIEWTSNTCQACRLMKDPIKAVNQRMKELLGYEPIREVNSSDNLEEANKARVTSFPTFDLMYAGKVVERKVGAVSIRDLEQMIREEYFKHAEEGNH